MVKDCDGRGNCFNQVGLDSHTQDKCKHNCKLQKCPKCGLNLPQWVLDCNEGFCQNCAVELFSHYQNIGLGNEKYYEFMQFMVKAFANKIE